MLSKEEIELLRANKPEGWLKIGADIMESSLTIADYSKAIETPDATVRRWFNYYCEQVEGAKETYNNNIGNAPKKPRPTKPAHTPEETINEALEDLETIQQKEATKKEKKASKNDAGVYIVCDKETKALINAAATLTTGGSVKQFMNLIIKDYFERNPELKKKAELFNEFLKNNTL